MSLKDQFFHSSLRAGILKTKKLTNLVKFASADLRPLLLLARFLAALDDVALDRIATVVARRRPFHFDMVTIT